MLVVSQIFLSLPLMLQSDNTALMIATGKGNIESVKQLLNSGAKVDATNWVSISLQVNKYSLDNLQHALPVVDWEGRSG